MLFLLPALLVYAVFSALPLLDTLRMGLYVADDSGATRFAGLVNFRTILLDADWSASFWNAMRNNLALLHGIHMLVQNPIATGAGGAAQPEAGCAARGTYRTLIFLPTLAVGGDHRLRLAVDALAAVGPG